MSPAKRLGGLQVPPAGRHVPLNDAAASSLGQLARHSGTQSLARQVLPKIALHEQLAGFIQLALVCRFFGFA